MEHVSLPTKIATWWMMVMGGILMGSVVGIPFLGGDPTAVELMALSLIGASLFGLIFLFLPGFFLLKRKRWAWKLNIINLCIIIAIIFTLLIYNILNFPKLGVPSKYLIEDFYFLIFLFPFLVPLTLLLLDKKYGKIAAVTILFLIIGYFGSLLGVKFYVDALYRQAVDFEERIEKELSVLYERALEKQDPEGCEEIKRYFFEELEKLPKLAQKQIQQPPLYWLKYLDCLREVAYMLKDESLCDRVHQAFPETGPGSAGERCRRIVRALKTNNVNECRYSNFIDEECVRRFEAEQ